VKTIFVPSIVDRAEPDAERTRSDASADIAAMVKTTPPGTGSRLLRPANAATGQDVATQIDPDFTLTPDALLTPTTL
jgi:hypothetical protein